VNSAVAEILTACPDWKSVRLAEVCEFRPSKSISRAALSDGDKVSFVPMNDLGELQKFFVTKEERSFGSVVGSYTYFANGDVLCAKITPCFENGKLGIAEGLKNGVGFGSSEFVVMRPNSKVLASEFLYYYLARDEFREVGARVMTGAVGHKRVPKEYFEGLPMPLPPLGEQKRIVAVLDQAFAALDRVRAHVETSLTDATGLFESVLRSAFESHTDWPRKFLPEISANLDRQRIPITKADRKPGVVPYYGASGVVDHVSGHIFDEDLLLVSEDGANLLARTYPIAFSVSGKSWVNNHAHVLRFADSDAQEYVRLYLNSISLAPYVSGMAQPKLSQKALNEIVIPFPDRKQRASIVAEANAVREQCDALTKNYELQVGDMASLRQSLLQQAFSGQLA
jgi:type I restriction enzyme, S subunit